MEDVPSAGGRYLFQMNPTTGAATLIGIVSASGDYSALAFNAAGTLFTIDTAGTGNSILLRIDPLTANIIGSIPMNINLGFVAGMTFDFATGLAYVADGQNEATNTLYSLDTLSGTATVIGPLGITSGLAGLAFRPVPECSTEWFLVLGVVSMFFAKRYFKRRVQQ
jgi:DNA-binding beta-propeller fold protein YncE